MLRFSCVAHSWLLALRFAYSHLGFGEQLIQIDRSVLGGILEAERDLRVAESGSCGVAVETAGALAQGLLHLITQLAASAIETAGDARFVLTEFAADPG